tara:strand:- start:1474 stop:1707 length:234 start_codon:yes stop_codon:yes gene_type:complete
MSFEDTIKLLLVSFDSTIKANLSVGLPLDLQVYVKDSFEVSDKPRINVGDPYFNAVSSGWGEALRNALTQLPSYKNE